LLDDAPLIIDRWIQEEKEGCPCETCVEKNSFNDDIYVVIQGHTRYIGEILANYSGYKNIVWAIDDDIQLRDFSLIFDSRINPIVVKKPLNPGFGNINLQSRSTIIGLGYAKSLGAKYCLKIRSDMIFSPLHRFLNLVDYKRLSFLYNVTYPFSDFEKPFEPVGQFLDSIAEYYGIEDKSRLTRNYMADFCAIGPVDDVISYYNVQEYPNDPRGEPVSAPAEYKFMFNYMKNKGWELDNTRENLRNKFGFFIPTLEENNIDLISIKYDYMNYSHIRKSENWHIES